jgi:hypothetical protein
MCSKSLLAPLEASNVVDSEGDAEMQWIVVVIDSAFSRIFSLATTLVAFSNEKSALTQTNQSS